MYRWTLYPLGKAILAPFFMAMGPVRVSGREHVPQRGGLLVVANHLSDIDPPLLGYAIPRPAWFMAKSELFQIPVLGTIIRAFRAFPVRRGRPDRTAIRKAVDLLRKGECVVIFPEGQISEDGNLQRPLAGAGLIWEQAQVPCICAGIVGSNRIIPFRSVFPKPAFGGVRVSFGKPLEWNSDMTPSAFSVWFLDEVSRLTGLAKPPMEKQS